MAQWDPVQYLRFATHRLRPALDLLARVPLEAPERVWDLGCGAGNVTRLLAGRWPQARIAGIDGSAAMLAEARAAAPGIEFAEADLAGWSPPAPADLLFSNAALQWLPDSAAAMRRLMRSLPRGGVLAVQMPRNHDAPSHREAAEVVEAHARRDRLRPLLRPFPVQGPAPQHRNLAPLAASLDIWETEYLHVLEGPDPVVEWTSGTSLRAILDVLGGVERERFLGEYRTRLRAAYPPEPDGTTLFPFRRIPAAPYGVRLPVDLETCELLPDRWENWLRHDPVRMVDSHADNLRRLAAIYIDCGNADQFQLHYGARQLHRSLERLGIAHRYEEFPDNHSSVDYRMDESLPFLEKALRGSS